jgi:hypothetical protein
MSVAFRPTTVRVPPVVVRGARLLAVAIVIGWSVANVIQRLGAWSLSDMDAYWNAATRLRESLPLYPPVTDPAAVDIYKYAPWFAWVWVPLTFLPKALIGVLWSVVLVGASVASIAPLLSRPNLTRMALATLLGSLLLWSASSGNVQPLLVTTLVHGVARRSGPLWIGLAASLKVLPIFYALVYLGRGAWIRAAVAVGVAAVLWAPALLYDLSSFQGGVADSPNPALAVSPVLYVGVVIAAVAATLVAARTRYAWLAAAGGLFAILPRVSLIDLSHLAVGASAPTELNEQRPETARPGRLR